MGGCGDGCKRERERVQQNEGKKKRKTEGVYELVFFSTKKRKINGKKEQGQRAQGLWQRRRRSKTLQVPWRRWRGAMNVVRVWTVEKDQKGVSP